MQCWKFQSEHFKSYNRTNKSKTVISKQTKPVYFQTRIAIVGNHVPLERRATLPHYPRKTFIGLREITFQLRYRNHLCSFENRKLHLRRQTRNKQGALCFKCVRLSASLLNSFLIGLFARTMKFWLAILGFSLSHLVRN